MAEEVKIIGYDTTGYELLTRAVADLLGSYPGLGDRTILFEELKESSGLAFSADSGALVMSERRSITDHVRQECQFPFFVVYRASASREHEKLKISQFLESLGKWICREPVKLGDEVYQLKTYPDLTAGRKITRVTRKNVYGLVPNDNGTQDWLLPVTVQYTNEFDMW